MAQDVHEVMKSRPGHIFTAALVAALTVAPVIAAMLFRERGATSDYAPEWWLVLAVTAVSVAGIGIAMIAGRRTVGSTMPWAAVLGLAAAVCVQDVTGMCQVARITPSAHSIFQITGSFYNPGPYGGFIALGLPVGLSLLLGGGRWQRYAAYALCALTLIVLPASASRSAWAAGALSCGFVAVCHNRAAVVAWLRRWWLPLLVGVAACAVGAYFLKADSANGRLFLWKIGLKACLDHPFGVGWHQVSGTFGDVQEAYFASGAGTEGEIAVAGAPEYLFNEYLQVALAWGWLAGIGFIAAIAATVLAAVRLRLYGAAGATVAFAVFAFSSYPLQFPLFVAAMAMLAMSVAAAALCRSRRAAAAFVLLAAAVASVASASAYRHRAMAQAYADWSNVRHFYKSAYFEVAARAMTPLRDAMDWNPPFMFELGHSLNRSAAYAESNRVLADAAKICADPVLFNVRGKNFQALGMRDSALSEFRRAADRLPSRMYPHFLMVRLAAESQPIDTALLMLAARKVMEMPVKVMSPAIGEMRDSTDAILSAHGIDLHPGTCLTNSRGRAKI